jgi:HNH endonuclease
MVTDAPDHPAPGPSLLTRIGGILVSREEIAAALSELEQSTGSWIGPRLDAIQSPLARTEFRKLADTYMRRYPDDDDYHAVVPDRERATPRLKAFICLLRRELAALGSEAAIAEQVGHEEDALPPLDAEDARKRTLAEIIRREGQPAFKTKLVRAYNGCCAVTGCDELGALEAAHIHPYQGPDWNKVQNGLLLRGDIHTLFDRHLLGINPQTRTVVLSLRLSGEHYRALDGQPVADPAEEGQRPSQEVLDERWKEFRRK